MSFRTILSLLALALALPAAAHADFSVGPMIGLAIDNVSNTGILSTTAPTTSRTGVTFGVTSQYDINENFALQPELMYLPKGADQPPYTGTAVTSGTLTTKLSYLEIPILAKARFSVDGGSTKAYGLLGPSFGFKISSKSTLDGVDQAATANTYNSFDFSVHLGAGIETKVMDNMTGFFDIRYVMGLTDIGNGVNSVISATKTREWLFLVGTRFSI